MRYSIFENGGSVRGTITVNGMQMTGPLRIKDGHTDELEAVNKRYVDEQVLSLDANNIKSGIIAPERLPGLSGSVSMETGSGVLVLSNSGVVPGSYSKVTVNGSGIVTSASGLSSVDLPQVPWTKINIDRPTTLAGYGILDGVSKENAVLGGQIVLYGQPIEDNDIATKAYVDNLVNGTSPHMVGDVVINPTGGPLPGFLRCNGGVVSKTMYSDLYSVVGDRFTFPRTPGHGKPHQLQHYFNTQINSGLSNFNNIGPYPEPAHGPLNYVIGNKLYLCGGLVVDNGVTSYSNKIYTCEILQDGSITPLVESATQLPIRVYSTQVVSHNNFLYFSGGFGIIDPNTGAAGATDRVYRATILPDNSHTVWTQIGTTPAPVWGAKAFIIGNYYYLLGGLTSSGHTAPIYRTTIHSDGSLGSWETMSHPFNPEFKQWIGSFIFKNYIYLFSGFDTSNFTLSKPTRDYYIKDCYKAHINEDGTLGAFTLMNYEYPEILSEFLVTDSKYAYSLSNYTPQYDPDTGELKVHHAPDKRGIRLEILPNGDFGEITQYPLPERMGSAALVVTGSRLYSFGYHTYTGTPTQTDGGNIHWIPWVGGLNNYKPFYDGTLTQSKPGLTENTFSLPDYSRQAITTGKEYYIKY